MTRDDIVALKSNCHVTFDSPQGKEVMGYLEKIGSWYPTVYDTADTNAIIARDANRKLIGTIKTILSLSSDQLIELMREEE
jgi:hypothetical protein